MKNALFPLLLTSLALVACGGDDPEPTCTSGTCDDTGMTDGDTVVEEDTAVEDVDLGPGTMTGQVFYNGEAVEGTLTIALYTDGYSADAEAVVMEIVENPSFSYSFSLEAPAGGYYLAAWLNVDGSPDATYDDGDLFGQTDDAGAIIAGEASGPINVELR